MKEWRDLGVLEDTYEVDRPISRDEMAKYFPKSDAQAFIGKPAAEILAALLQCADSRDQAQFGGEYHG